MAQPFEAYRARRLGEVNTRYAEFIAQGFPATLGGIPETLQCATNLDRTNWLTLLGICVEAIGGGLGNEQIPVAIRCTSNRSYAMTFTEAAALVRAIRSWAAAAQANWWRLKDAVRDCPGREELNLIDLEEGWP